MRQIIFICLFFITSASFAQTDYYNSEAAWQKVVPETVVAGHPEIDTAIIVASTRSEQKNNVRFMSEERDEAQIHFFFVYSHSGQWHVLKTNGLKEAVSYMPHKDRDWVVYTEGMGKLFTSDLTRGMAMASEYSVNVILLDYPSITTTRKQLANYKFALHNARIAYKDFLPVLETVKKLHDEHELGTGHLSLFFHSMGNNVMRELAKNNLLFSLRNEVWVDNLILNAPCVPERRHARWLKEVKFAKNIFVHYNPKDHTLGGAHLLSLKKQLGEKVRRPLCEGVYYINFHPVIDRDHSCFLSVYEHPQTHPEAIRHYSSLFHGNLPELTNAHFYGPSSYKHIGIDLLPQR